MKKGTITLFFALPVAIVLLTAFNRGPIAAMPGTEESDSSATHFPQEKHLKHVKQLTFGGENAEAYWSFDNTRLSFQGKNNNKGLLCDQIFMLNVNDTTSRRLISRFNTCACTETSSAETDSSQIMNLGFKASARAMQIR